MTEEILRPDVADGKLETSKEAAARNGLSLSVIRGNFRRYASKAPKPVKIRNGRTKLFLREEIDAFLTYVSERTEPRTALEVAESEVCRISEALEESKRRMAKWKEEYEKASRDEKYFTSELRRAQERVELERGVRNR